MIVTTTEYNTKLIWIFLYWYAKEMPILIVRNIFLYIESVSLIFSFQFLLKTLFYPWKNQLYAYPNKGFDLRAVFEVWLSNMVSRLVGVVIRLLTVLLGLVVIFMIALIGFTLLVIWVSFPILLPIVLVLSIL